MIHDLDTTLKALLEKEIPKGDLQDHAVTVTISFERPDQISAVWRRLAGHRSVLVRRAREPRPAQQRGDDANASQAAQRSAGCPRCALTAPT